MDDARGLLNPSAAGQAPPSRLKDAAAAHRVISVLVADDQPRARARAKIRGMLDGNPPYNPEELRRLGQGYRTNLNFREGSAILAARRSSYYNLIMDAEQLVRFSLRRTQKALAAARMDVRSQVDPDPLEYPEILAEEFHRSLLEWDGFLFETMRIQDEMISYGVGPAFFPDAHDWRFRAAAMGDVFVPNRAPANVEGQEVVVVQTRYRVTELFEKIADPEQTAVSEALGWSSTLLKQVIHDAYNNHGVHGSWEDIQQRIKNDDLAESYAGPAPLRVYQVFWKEFDGTYSLGIVIPDASEKRFLFKSVGCYKALTEVLVMFFAGIGDGTYHSVRGLGYEIFPHCEVSNRVLNSIVDGTTLAAGVVLQQRAGNAPLVPKMLKIGPFAVLPPGFEMVAHGFNPNMAGVFQVRDLLHNTMSNNVGMFRPAMSEMPHEQRRTAREVMVAHQKEVSLEQTEVNFYYLQWDRLYREMFRRFLSADYPKGHPGWDAREAFRTRCIDRGLPPALLNADYWVVQASRSLGSGSPVMRDENSQRLLEIAPYLDRRGKYQAIRNRVVTLAGPGNVDRFLGEMDRDTIPVMDTSLARMESNFMVMGMPATAGAGEDHIAHLEMHLSALNEFIQQVEGGGPDTDFVHAVKVLEQFMSHMYEHTQFLEGNPAFADDLKQAAEIEKQLRQLHGRWSAAAGRQVEAAEQQAAEQQTELSETAQVAIEKERMKIAAQHEERMTGIQLKEQSLAQARAQKAAHGMQIKEALAQQRMRLEEEKAAMKRGEDRGVDS